jgi:hypothetical protein
MSDEKKIAGTTPVSFRLFGSPEFVVKLQREINAVVARRIKPPPQVVPERVVDVAITRKLVETLHSAWNKLFIGNDATAIDRQTDSDRVRFYFLR